MGLINWVEVTRAYFPLLWIVAICVLTIQLSWLLYHHRFDVHVSEILQ